MSSGDAPQFEPFFLAEDAHIARQRPDGKTHKSPGPHLRSSSKLFRAQPVRGGSMTNRSQNHNLRSYPGS